MQITPEMIEAGARALHGITRRRLRAWDLKPWDEIAEFAKTQYRREAWACLKAALGGDANAKTIQRSGD